MIAKNNLVKISETLWEIPKTFRSDMKVAARIYASEKMLDEILKDRSLEQLINVATLEGIQKYALAMPDAHEGYGFPIGGVAAFDLDKGVISPGGIGYDINCGVRLLRSQKSANQIRPAAQKLADTIYKEVPSGVGQGGRINLKGKELDEVLEKGAKQAIEMGYGKESDLETIESNGWLKEADAEKVSFVAKNRGKNQLGTLGAGNHFVEVDEVDEIFDSEEAGKMKIFQGQATVLIHTGSRGLGHQIATDYIRTMMKAMPKYEIKIVDRELACAPFNSKEGQDYFKAMSAGANFAWANRQVITWEVRKAWEEVFGDKDLEVVYDVAHNIAKIENNLLVHRKGATRAFEGQPVIIPGSMGTASYVLVGQKKALEESFGSTCHGAGRRMSRTQAKKEIRGSQLKQELAEKGIVINAGSLSGLAEEAPEAYKDIDEVVEIIHKSGIAKKVARLKPLVVIKG